MWQRDNPAEHEIFCIFVKRQSKTSQTHTIITGIFELCLHLGSSKCVHRNRIDPECEIFVQPSKMKIQAEYMPTKTQGNCRDKMLKETKTILILVTDEL